MGALLAKAKAKPSIVLVVCCLLLLPFLFKSSSMEEQKATWLWDASLIENPGTVLDFCKEQGVNVIFLQIQKNVEAEQYRKFISEAHQEDISVHALDGKPQWAYQEQQTEADQFMDWVLDYNRKASPEERFAGIQLDVEPYQLKRWERDQTGVVNEWSRNMEEWTNKGRNGGLYMSAAVPFWLGKIEADDSSGSLSRWMLGRFDALAVMSYRDSGQKMVDLSKEMLNEADQLGKSVWIGMELGDTKEGDHVSFFGKSLPVMEEEMKQVYRLGDSYSSFAGLAVHHYEAWHEKIASADPKQEQSSMRN
ncbi:hypothetical protein J23TS9_04360 [Paenibacillus sp. J23TS9]|uniref:hypothetical protein n=1 Tax=Paenibacillus sp. J23TS9 TaxID=2807193 RepID=UPI001B24DD33|nr:hypothetical protein [Paenibacillus sp. J23TS9]GIP25306.1 hypothetical protein J23TS9_04360 [Paenibacillus sp. J23TS9]